MEYKFSVIIPVYNAEKTIRRCLDSILAQNCPKAQIILVNDGSKDRSGEICRAYAAENSCIVYIEQKNSGASSARNTGLDAATGTYVTFVDSDDLVEETYFAQLDAPDEDFTVFSYNTICSSGVIGYQFSRDLLAAATHTERILMVLRDRLAGPVNKRFLRSIIEKNHLRFKNDLIIGEDFIFGLEYMLLCDTSRVLPRKLYRVDETGMESITRGGRYDFSQFVRIYDYAFDIAENCGWSPENKEKLQQQLDYLFCRTAFACAERCLNPGGQIKLGDCIALFHSRYRSGIRPMNMVHRCMKACLRYRVVPVYGIIALAHRWAAKK